jgi:hypothetical protein
VGLVDQLLQSATPHFQVYKALNAVCPQCNSQMVLKYASNPRRHSWRKLSVIVCCSNDCDRAIWNSKADEKQFTHWWIDGNRNLEGLIGIINSLTNEDKKLLLDLREDVRALNFMTHDAHAN